MIENYIMHLLIFIGIYAIFAIMQNVTIGNLGLLSLGNLAFFGVGAYTSALLTINGVPFLIAFLIAGIFGMLTSLIMTYLMKRLKGDYYALGTLAFLFVIQSLVWNWTSLTRGALGLPKIPKPEIFGFVIDSLGEYLIFVSIIAIIFIIITRLILRSSYNLVLGSIRDNQMASEVLGYNTFKIKIQTMALVGFATGISGSLFAHYITFIDPTTVMLTEAIFILTIVIVGGLGSMKGSIVGTFLILLLPELLRFLDLPTSTIGPMRQIIYSIILLAIIYYRPKGLFGEVEL